MYDRGDADTYIIGAGRGTRRRRDGVGNMPGAGGSIRHWRLRASSARRSCTRIRTDGFGLSMSVWTYSREESQRKLNKTEHNKTQVKQNKREQTNVQLKLDRRKHEVVRSQLHRCRSPRSNIRWKALDEVYNVYILLVNSDHVICTLFRIIR